MYSNSLSGMLVWPPWAVLTPLAPRSWTGRLKVIDGRASRGTSGTVLMSGTGAVSDSRNWPRGSGQAVATSGCSIAISLITDGRAGTECLGPHSRLIDALISGIGQGR